MSSLKIYDMKNDEFVMLGLMLGINSERKLMEELLKARQSGSPDPPIYMYMSVHFWSRRQIEQRCC